MTALDPQPTEFGIGRVFDEDELRRARLHRRERTNREAFGAMLRNKLQGDPVRVQNLRANYQPIIDGLTDAQMDEPDPDEREQNNWSPQ